MEKLGAYRHCIQELLLDYSQHKPAQGEIEVKTILDAEMTTEGLMKEGLISR